MRALIMFLLAWVLGKKKPALPPDPVPVETPEALAGNPARYWGRPEIDRAIERAREQEAAGAEDPGVDIDYPACAECSANAGREVRHPSAEYLCANGLAICRECSRVGKARVTDLRGGRLSYEWSRLPLHRNKIGRWCRGRGHPVPESREEEHAS